MTETDPLLQTIGRTTNLNNRDMDATQEVAGRKTYKFPSSTYDPFSHKGTISVSLTEYELGPNPNTEAEVMRQVWTNVKDYSLGECHHSHHRIVLSKIQSFLAHHPEELTLESLAYLKQLVSGLEEPLIVDPVPVQTREGKVEKAKRSTRRATHDPILPFVSQPPSQTEAANEEDFLRKLRHYYWEESIEEVKKEAYKDPPAGSPRQNYYRSEAVRIYVQRRANGKCEGCGNKAPFKNADGQPYLESHHTIRVADGAPDHPRWVIALCPTCHRRAHHAKDAELFNEKLKRTVHSLEDEATVSG